MLPPKSPFYKIISIPELVDILSSYLPLSSICSLRLVSSYLRIEFSNPKWFYKDIDHTDLYKKSRFWGDASSGHLFVYVRSFSLHLGLKIFSVDRSWISRLISECHNLTELSFEVDHLKDSPAKFFEDMYWVWEQVSLVSTRLRKLSIKEINLYGSKDQLLAFDSIPRLFLPALRSFTIDGSSHYPLPKLNMDNLVKFLELTPSLVEMDIVSARLDGGDGIYANRRVIPGLKKLTINLAISDSIARWITNTLPGLHELIVADLGGFKRIIRHCSNDQKISEADNDQLTPSMECPFWIPFPELRQLKVLDQRSEGHSEMKLPECLNNLEIRMPSAKLDLNNLMIPGISLQRLSLNLASSSCFLKYYSKNWCRLLTHLAIDNGLTILCDILCEEHAAYNANKSTRSWSTHHLSEEFIISRIPFASTLISLDLIGNLESINTEGMDSYLNALLRYLPKIQEFMMETQPYSGFNLFKGLGKDCHSNSNDMSQWLDDDDKRYKSLDRSKERPFLRKIKFGQTKMLDNSTVKLRLQKQFSSLESIETPLLEIFYCTMGMGT